MIKPRKTSIYISLMLFALIFLVMGASVEATSTGKPNNSSGCSCHGSGSVSSTVTPTHSGFPADYTPGQTYVVTIGMTTSQSGSEGGFSFTTNKGTLALNHHDSNVQISGSSATHTNSGVRSWSFEWTAPSTGSGTVNLQVATNAVDGGGTTAGDFWSTLSWSINEVPPPTDTDGDGVIDDEDLCTNTPNGESVDSDGCSQSQLDDDQDGVMNDVDQCPNTPSGIVVDNTGCPIDTDGDSYADNIDDCVDEAGSSTIDRTGCIDSDGDGYSNPSSSWTISEGADAFPLESSQWADTDQDGYGDNPDGGYADDCMLVAGDSEFDRMGCPDLDADGFSDPDDDWPTTDCDSPWGLCADAFINEPTQWTDFDGDGFGDNFGNQSWQDTRDESWPGIYMFLAENQDACALFAGTSTEGGIMGCPDFDEDGWADSHDSDDDNDGIDDIDEVQQGTDSKMKDTDGDGVDDGEDEFPTDSTETLDSDGDGVGDNADQCEGHDDSIDVDNDIIIDGCDDFIDSDGDGISDADEILNGTNPAMMDTDEDGVNDGEDAFPTNITETIDSDGDGVGDNADAFDNDVNESTDTDMDGVGDNADQCEGHDDSTDVDQDDTPDDCDSLIDNDGDGVSNSQDAFPNDVNETLDSDGDGVGNNQQAAAELATEEEAKQKMIIWSSVVVVMIILGIVAFFVLRKGDEGEEIPKQSPMMNFNNNQVVQQAYVPEPTVVNQWTDQAGHTWRSMSDGSTLWWNGADWQKT